MTFGLLFEENIRKSTVFYKAVVVLDLIRWLIINQRLSLRLNIRLRRAFIIRSPAPPLQQSRSSPPVSHIHFSAKKSNTSLIERYIHWIYRSVFVILHYGNKEWKVQNYRKGHLPCCRNLNGFSRDLLDVVQQLRRFHNNRLLLLLCSSGAFIQQVS